MAILSAIYQVEVDTGAGYSVLAANAVVKVSGMATISGNRKTPLLAGDMATLQIQLTIAMSALASVPRNMPVRVTYTVGGVQARAFVGTRTTAHRNRKSRQWEISCTGIAAAVGKTRIESRLFLQRPVATKTTAATVEDPASGSYQAGPINFALWKAGGRPYEQSASYPAARFYYSLDQALIAPPFAWFHGENTWDECLKLVRASGGQLFQDQAGIVRYRQPLGFGDGTATHTFSDTGSYSTSRTIYENLEEDDNGEAIFTRVLCPYVIRVQLPLQVVAEQTQPRIIPALKTITIPIDFQHPLASLETETVTTLKDEAFLMIGPGGFVAPEASWSHSIVWYAQRVEITITNNATAPLTLEKLTLRGEPVAPGEASSVAVGSSDETNTLTIEESLYIQQESDARILGSLFLAMQSGAGAVRSVKKCAYNPARYIGETVYLECAVFGFGAIRHVIIAVDHEAGKTAEYVMVDVSALPKASDFYVVGSTDWSGQTKMLSW